MRINKLLISTQNPGKFAEISERLTTTGIDLVSLQDLNITKDYEETGTTFEENAVAKARFYHGLSGLATLADDSGLSVDALGGEPGIHSRRWPGYAASDKELLDMLMSKLKDISLEARTAKFRTVTAIVDEQNMWLGQGQIAGIILKEPASDIEEGLPFSCVFQPDGYSKVFSQLTNQEKNSISHRGHAIEELIKQLF